jgi:glutaredoxin 3
MTPDVLLYTTSWCPFCDRAKQFFKKKGLRWNEIDIEADPANRQAMTKASGRNTVPQTFINGTHVGGCDDLLELDAKGGLDELLARRPAAS